MSEVQTGEVTQAVRTAEVDGISVHQGDFIGLRNGKLVVRGEQSPGRLRSICSRKWTPPRAA